MQLHTCQVETEVQFTVTDLTYTSKCISSLTIQHTRSLCRSYIVRFGNRHRRIGGCLLVSALGESSLELACLLLHR